MKIKNNVNTYNDHRKLRNSLMRALKLHQKLNKRHGKDGSYATVNKVCKKHLDELKNRPGKYKLKAK